MKCEKDIIECKNGYNYIEGKCVPMACGSNNILFNDKCCGITDCIDG